MPKTAATTEKGKTSVQTYVNNLLSHVVEKNPGEKEFHQAVKEVLELMEIQLSN